MNSKILLIIIVFVLVIIILFAFFQSSMAGSNLIASTKICSSLTKYRSLFECEENPFGVKYFAKIDPSMIDAGNNYYDKMGNFITGCGGFTGGNISAEEIQKCNQFYQLKCKKLICGNP